MTERWTPLIFTLSCAAKGRAMVNRVKTLVVTRPVGGQALGPQRIIDHRPARVSHGDGFALWGVAIPVISLMMAGLFIMVLSTFVEVRSPSPSRLSSDTQEDVEVGLPVIDEVEIGETTVRLGPALFR